MSRVYKYEIPMRDLGGISMPQGAEILHVAEQHGVPCLWARVDPEAPMEDVALSVRGTGHDGADGEHVGSFFMQGGDLVFHVFRR